MAENIRHLRVALSAMLTLMMLAGGCGVFTSSGSDNGLELAFNLSGLPARMDFPERPVFLRESIFSEIPGKIGSHGAALTAFDDGELLAAWYSYEGPYELIGSAIYTARKTPAADRWTVPKMIIDRQLGDGNPVLYSEGENVWLFQAVVPLKWGTAHIEVQRSDDRGRTWQQPRVLTSVLGSNVRYPPIRTAAGTLLLPAYNDLMARSMFFESTDGSDWRFLSAVSSDPNNIQPSIARLDDGRILAVMRNTDVGWLWAMVSADNGKSWSQPIDSGFPSAETAAALVKLASGNLILVFTDDPTGDSRLAITISSDGGLTWHDMKVLTDGDVTYSYPAVVQTSDGLIHILVTSNRTTIEHITINEAWIVSE